MSLLLDALKRAEQEKLGRQERGQPEAPAPPSRVLELQPMAAPAAGEAGARAAQAVFDAKAAGRAPARSRKVLWTVLAVSLAAMAGVGGYVWYSVQSLAPRASAAVRRPVPPPPPIPAAAPEAKAAAAPVAAAGSPASTSAIVPPAGAKPAPAVSAEAEKAPRGGRGEAPHPPAAAEASARVAAAVLSARPAAPAQAPRVQLERSAEPPRIPAEIVSGYEALRRGDLEAARRAYRAALAADGASVDALLGLATIDARSGNGTAALGHYRRALQLDPRNATALAGLAAVAQSARPEAVETQLRRELARVPGSGPLHFALGNVYAAQGRWTEAQAEYFEAHRLDPASADAAFNLAVSLDHLGQRRMAADFYRRALQAAGERGAQFDPDAVRRRLAELPS